MRMIALVLMCFICGGTGRRVQTQSEHVQGSSPQEQPSRSLATLLSAFNPSVGFPRYGGGGSKPLPVPFGRSNDPRMEVEQTYIMIKPDAVHRGLIGEIIQRFERRGYQLVAMKMKLPTEELVRKHYEMLVDKPYFPQLVNFLISGPVVCMVWEGESAVSIARKMLGATDPQEAWPGTIRGDYAVRIGRNVCHGADTVENAQREINIWFDKDEIIDWTPSMSEWIYREEDLVAN